jgi:hypothetical protein
LVLWERPRATANRFGLLLRIIGDAAGHRLFDRFPPRRRGLLRRWLPSRWRRYRGIDGGHHHSRRCEHDDRSAGDDVIIDGCDHDDYGGGPGHQFHDHARRDTSTRFHDHHSHDHHHHDYHFGDGHDLGADDDDIGGVDDDHEPTVGLALSIGRELPIQPGEPFDLRG